LTLSLALSALSLSKQRGVPAAGEPKECWISEDRASILDILHWEENMMQLQNASTSMRMLFLMIAVLVWLGIWLSGYNTVHWILYLPAAFLTFAAATGICPGLHILGKIFAKT
jgi:hypothetical protein